MVVLILAAACAATESSLIEAASKGDTEKVKALLSQVADVNVKSDTVTALSAAASGGHIDTVQALRVKVADVNAKRDDGNTVLMIAKAEGNKEIVRLLKEAGAKE